MHQVTLQAYPYRSFLDRCVRTEDFTPLNSFILATFSNPHVLNESFKLNLYRFSDRTSHNVDIDFALRFFDDISSCKTGTPDIVLRAVVFSMVTQEHVLTQIDKANLQKSGFMRTYFILLLDLQLFEIPNIRILKLLADHLQCLAEESLKVLVRWLCDLDTHRMQLIVALVQKSLSTEILKLLPGQQYQLLNPKTVTSQIQACCSVLQLLFLSNEMKQRVSLDSFKNQEVMRHFDVAEQFKVNYKGIKILNFMLFPFLLSIDYKNRLLEIETRVEHHINMQRGLANMMSGAEELKPNQTVINVIYFMLQVNRESILDDSIDQLSKTKVNLKNPLKITFLGEPGDDGGGVKKEYFQLLIKEIFNPNRDLFVTKNNNRYHWFNSQTFEAPIMFEFLGMILGLSIYNTTLLELKFPKLLYRKLLLKQNQMTDPLEELSEIEPDFYKSFKYLLETQENLDDLQLVFEVETENYGSKAKHLLKPYGNLIKVTQSNKHEYVKLYANWLVNISVEKQFVPFKRGFDKVVTGDVIHLFSPQELERVICGSENLDFKELEKVVKYEGGFSDRTPIIRALWDILHNFDLETKKAFLFFVTGSDRAPIRGLSNLKMIIQRESDSEHLPCAHTCFSVLLLPEYSCREKLREKLQLALQFKESFGLI